MANTTGGETVKFGEFQVSDKIGAGGMGTVWEAHHSRLPQRFAVKLSTHHQATQPEYRQRFEREVRAMARLRHPNVVRVFDYGVYLGGPGPDAPRRGTPWVVMEFAPGGELEPEEVDDWESLRDVLHALLAGLAHSHSRGLIHRDIKPQNLLWVERRGQMVPAVADFGIAHALDRQRPSLADDFTNRNAEEATGTPRYMAPEQFMGLWRDYGPPTDLYAAGILAYVLACRDAPFHGDNLYQYAAEHMGTPFPALKPVFDVPDEFEEWVKHMTAKKPSERPQTARRALELLGVVEPRSWMGWRAVEPDDEPGRAPAGLGLFGLQRTYLVGREAQRDALWKALGEAVEAEQTVARCLVGRSGVGKTRLAEWLSELALESDRVATVFRASFSRDRRETSGLAWMLAEHLRCAGMHSEPLAERLDELLGDRWENEALRALQQVVSQAESVASEVPAPTVKESMTVEMCRRVIADAAERGPVVIQLEDVDDDPTGLSVRFGEAMADSGVPGVLVVATSHRAIDGVETIDVKSLEADAFRRLLRDELGLPAEISDVVERVADGNPQFALQVLEHWFEAGELQVVDGDLVLETADIPATLDALWQARIAQLSTRLDDDAAPVLTSAGVLGSPIEPTEWLATASELGVDIDSPLFGDVAAAMIEAGIGKWDDADRMVLAHRTIAPLLADSGGGSERRRAHGAAARALSCLYPSSEHGLALRVAEHFRESGQPRLAWIALQPALDAALDVVDSTEIGKVAEAMLDTLDATGTGEDDPRHVKASALKAIELVMTSRDDDRARGISILETARRKVAGDETETAAIVESIWAWSAISRGGRDEAAKVLEEVIARPGLSERTRAMSRVFLTHLYTYLHDEEGVSRHAHETIASDAPAAWKLRAHEALIHQALAARDAEAAKKHAFPALIIAKQLGRIHLEVHIENLAGFIADLDDDPARAESHHARSERLASLVQPQSAVRLLAREYRARAMLRQDKLREAFALLWSLADEVDAGRAPRVFPWDALHAVAILLGEPEAEERAASRALEMKDPNALHVRAAAMTLRGLRQAERHDEAEAFEQRARQAFDAQPGVSDADLARLSGASPLTEDA